MKAVWSFWTKPFRASHQYRWTSPLHHLLAWVLSVETVRTHYPDTALFADEEGARLLVDGLRLEFGTVSTELEQLRDESPQWWVLGKLWTYRAQTAPFIHFDSDVFLWNGLPGALEQSPVLAQNPECFPVADDSWYRRDRYERAIRAAGGWMPEEWAWSTAHGHHSAACCGILGGQAVGFLAHYAHMAMSTIRHPRNQAAWASIGNVEGDNIIFEQFLLSACVNYHRQSSVSPYRNVRLEYLFGSWEDAFNERTAAQAGYTHLIGGAKSNLDIARRLVNRVRRDYPQYFERCVRLSGGTLC